MNQTLLVELSIPIPEDSILIKKIDYEQLIKAESKGQFANIAWLKSKTGINSLETLKEKILYPFKNELDIQKGGFVFYPRAKGEPFMMLKSKMEEWLENNFDRIFN